MAKIGNRNRKIGFSYEHRFVGKLFSKGAKYVLRHYGSLGKTDIEWVDQFGFKNEAQLKFSTKRLPKVTGEELDKIKEYAATKEGIKIWIVCKQSHKPEVWQAIN